MKTNLITMIFSFAWQNPTRENDHISFILSNQSRNVMLRCYRVGMCFFFSKGYINNLFLAIFSFFFICANKFLLFSINIKSKRFIQLDLQFDKTKTQLTSRRTHVLCHYQTFCHCLTNSRSINFSRQ